MCCKWVKRMPGDTDPWSTLGSQTGSGVASATWPAGSRHEELPWVPSGGCPSWAWSDNMLTRELSRTSLMRIPPSWPNPLLKAPPLNTIILETKFLYINFEGTQTFSLWRYVTMYNKVKKDLGSSIQTQVWINNFPERNNWPWICLCLYFSLS